MSDDDATADLGCVIGDPAVSRVVHAFALLHGVRIVVAGPERDVIAAFGRDETVPGSLPAESAGAVVRSVEVYDRVSGWIAAEAEEGAGDPDTEAAVGAVVDRVLSASLHDAGLRPGYPLQLDSTVEDSAWDRQFLKPWCLRWKK